MVMWVKIEKRAEKSDAYFKTEDVVRLTLRLDEYARDHDIPAYWELMIYLRGESFESKYFNTKEEAEKWARENIFNAGSESNAPNLQETLLNLDLGLKYGTYSDNDKLSIIDSAMIVLQRHRAALTSKERGW